MTRLLIFDFDGTLADTRATIVRTMTQTLIKTGYPVPSEEEIAGTIGLPLEEGFIQLVPGLSEDRSLFCAKIYRDIFEINRKRLIPKPFPHVKETLDILAGKGYTMAIASSRMSASLNGFLEEMDLARNFSYIVGADNVTNAKPHPEPVLKTLEALGIPAEEAMVVGDMPVDILMGRRAGTKTCGVTYGNSCRKDLQSAGVDCIIDNFSSLADLLP